MLPLEGIWAASFRLRLWAPNEIVFIVLYSDDSKSGFTVVLVGDDYS